MFDSAWRGFPRSRLDDPFPFDWCRAGGMVMFVAYEGFDLISNAAENVRDP